jgi:UDP-GlcNAc:undecaprenyl-phosphate/decaprenyl-phosphate GlcNAc-1-phosphate transferase
MRTAGVAFILACLVSALLTPMVRRFALRHHLFDDHVSSRKVHGRPIPRLGGLGIAAGFYAPLLGLLFASTGVGLIFYASSRMAIAFLAGGAAILALGIYDDIRGSGAFAKFIAQFIIAGALYFAGFRIDQISLPFVHALSLGPLSFVFTLLWIVGVINAMNLIDGLDGLATGVGLLGVTTTFVLAAIRGDPIMMLFMAALGGSLLGFLIYNFNPASIFMGDTGAMFIGYVLGVGATQTSTKSSTAVAILVPMVALGVPIADTALAMLRRALSGRPMFSADRSHIHHKLLDLGLTQRQAVMVLYGVSFLLGGMALLLTVASSVQAALILVAMGLAGFLGIRKLGYGHLRRAVSSQAQIDVRRQLDRLATAADEERLWRELKGAAQAIGLVSIRISLMYQHESDSVSIQREHGDWNDSDPVYGSFEAAAAATAIKVEYRCRERLDGGTLYDLQQTTEYACTRIFGRKKAPTALQAGESGAASPFAPIQSPSTNPFASPKQGSEPG